MRVSDLFPSTPILHAVTMLVSIFFQSLHAIIRSTMQEKVVCAVIYYFFTVFVWPFVHMVQPFVRRSNIIPPPERSSQVRSGSATPEKCGDVSLRPLDVRVATLYFLTYLFSSDRHPGQTGAGATVVVVHRPTLCWIQQHSTVTPPSKHANVHLLLTYLPAAPVSRVCSFCRRLCFIRFYRYRPDKACCCSEMFVYEDISSCDEGKKDSSPDSSGNVSDSNDKAKTELEPVASATAVSPPQQEEKQSGWYLKNFLKKSTPDKKNTTRTSQQVGVVNAHMYCVIT